MFIDDAQTIIDVRLNCFTKQAVCGFAHFQSKGRNIVNLLKLGGQKIASVINVRNLTDEETTDKTERQLVMAS